MLEGFDNYPSESVQRELNKILEDYFLVENT